jgi:hypothetical protein
VDIGYGRYITESEFDHGSPVIVIGNEVAEKLFVAPEIAVGKLGAGTRKKSTGDRRYKKNKARA